MLTPLWILVTLLAGPSLCSRPIYSGGSQVHNLTQYGWRCTLERSHCGIINQDRMPEQFVYYPDSIINNARGFYLLNMAWCTRGGARLMTPYYSLQFFSPVCLRLHFLVFGFGVEWIRIYQQDNRNQMIWRETPKLGDQVQRYEVPVLLKLFKPT